MSSRNTVLIVDDIEMNRAILREILKDKYDIIEADNGDDAIALAEKNIDKINVILLDDLMPQKDGIKTINELKEFGVTNIIPTILMSADLDADYIANSHELGASDIIEKPFDPNAVIRRVDNLVELYEQKYRLEQLLKKQATFLMQQSEKISRQQEIISNMNNTMLDTLSTIIEYRDVESGKHVHRIRKFTEILLRVVAEKCPEYNLTESKINLIVSASSVHDIGKIAIPDSILLAPRRLTYDEFRIMKEHTTKGSEILNLLDLPEKSEYFQYCYDICRYHHEKWDGMGYPDGLRGDDIPIWAQVVSVADCYDALTSDRPYKAGIPHAKAAEMIKTGACGCFSDKLMECFTLVLPQFELLAKTYADTAHIDKDKQTKNSLNAANNMVKRNFTDTAMSIYANMSREELIGALERQKQVAKETHERDCQIFYRINDLVFECDLKHDNFYVRKGNWENMYNYFPKNYTEAVSMIASSCHPDDVVAFNKMFRLSNVKRAVETGKEKLEFDGRFIKGNNAYKWYRCILIPFCEDGVLRKLYCCASKISEKNAESSDDRYKDQHDGLTGLWNVDYLKKAVDDYLLNAGKDGMHVLINIDVDDFKALSFATSTTFGDEVLCRIADKLRTHFTGDSVIARTDSDGFAVFVRDCFDVRNVLLSVESLYESMHMSFDYLLTKHNVSVSMGVAQYPKDGTNFTELMNNADFATEMAKLRGKNMYLFYHNDMRKFFDERPVLSLISDNEKVDIYNFKRVFIPVLDAGTNRIASYDYLELPNTDIQYSAEDLCEMLSVADNATVLGINCIKRLFADLYELEQECGELPEITLYTLFKGADVPTILKTISDILEVHPIDCGKITINIIQNMLNTMSYRQLTNFSDEIHMFGFKLGIYSVGTEYMNVKCFADKLFDSVELSANLINSVIYGYYPNRLLRDLLRYFSASGMTVRLSKDLSATTVESVRKFCNEEFHYHTSMALTIDKLRTEMELSKNIPTTPILSHEKYELALTHDMYNEIMMEMKCVVFRWQIKNDKIWFSGSFKEIYGCEPPTENLIEFVKTTDLVHHEDREKYIDHLLAAKSGCRSGECFVRLKKPGVDDNYRWSKIRLNCVTDEYGVPDSIVGSDTDIDDERREHENLKGFARHDFLTQLLNRRSLKAEIDEFLQTSEAECGVHAFMIVDIDNFKNVYDEMGQVFADTVLKDITERLKKLFCERDIIGRVGRDQFVIFIKNIESDGILPKRAESICEILNREYESGENHASVSGSVGISMYPQDGASYDELYANSSLALFSIKHKGKNSWLFYNRKLFRDDIEENDDK